MEYCTVLNCNEGWNTAIMEACDALRGYAHLLTLDRRLHAVDGVSPQDSVREAVRQCIQDGYLVDYLTEHRAKVEDMLYTIQDEERAMRVHWEAVEREAREKGFSDGRAAGYSEGRSTGYSEGREAGFADGRKAGYDSGYDSGRDETLSKLRSMGLIDQAAIDALAVTE